MSRQGDAEPLLRLDDRKALVTGAGSGIGAAAVCALARAGAEVVLLGRTRSRLEQVAAEIDASGGRALPLVCDVTHTAAMREAIGGLDSLDILLNNAGVNIAERFVDVSVTLRTLTPLGREQTPDDIGNTVAFLCSDRAADITGQVMAVDGGIVRSQAA
jgi:NAD(P)-dependent dehydrogenase (short-subunit alcohol dehydrogenase family)